MVKSKTNFAQLYLKGKTYDLPILSPTSGPDVLDIRKLYADANVFTYDPGFTSTAACDSSITYIDGNAGELQHRGYPIDQLAEKSHYLEVCFLLLYGHLPSGDELESFESLVTNPTMLHEQMVNLFRGFRRDAHPMAIMTGVVGAMSAFYHDSTDVNDPHQREVASIRLIAKMPTIAAMAYKYSVGQPFVYPQNKLNYADKIIKLNLIAHENDKDLASKVRESQQTNPAAKYLIIKPQRAGMQTSEMHIPISAYNRTLKFKDENELFYSTICRLNL